MPKKTAKDLTVDDVKRAKPQNKPYELRDAKQQGLLLRVQPSGSKSWVVVYTVNDSRNAKTRKTLGDASRVTLARARTLAKKATAAAEEGRDPYKDQKAAKSALLGKYLRGPYKEYAETHILSHKDLLARLNRNWKHLASRSMAEITPMDVQRWRKKKGQEQNPVTFDTLQRELTYLKACLNTAAKVHKLIDRHQLDAYSLTRDTLQLQDKEKPKPRHLTEAEEVALRGALTAREEESRNARERMRQWEKQRGKPLSPSLPDTQYVDHVQPIILLALNTGLRRGDLFSLEWRHIDFKSNQIRKVINKTRRKNPKLTPAVLPISNEAQAILKKWKKQSSGEGLVFPSPVTGQQLDNIKSAWEKVIKDSGVENFRFHDLRHSFASKLVMAGVDITTVKELMTHSDLKMTMVYAHVSEDHKAAALEKAFGGTP